MKYLLIILSVFCSFQSYSQEPNKAACNKKTDIHSLSPEFWEFIRFADATRDIYRDAEAMKRFTDSIWRKNNIPDTSAPKHIEIGLSLTDYSTSVKTYPPPYIILYGVNDSTLHGYINPEAKYGFTRQGDTVFFTIKRKQ